MTFVVLNGLPSSQIPPFHSFSSHIQNDDSASRIRRRNPIITLRRVYLETQIRVSPRGGCAPIQSSSVDGPDEEAPNQKPIQPSSSFQARDDEEVKDLGVRAALSMLKFYKREISPLLPSSCRYVPTCSEYSMEAYTKYGVVKGTVLTAWRLCRCNPLGGSGFDPPRWFNDSSHTEEEQ